MNIIASCVALIASFLVLCVAEEQGRGWAAVVLAFLAVAVFVFAVALFQGLDVTRFFGR